MRTRSLALALTLALAIAAPAARAADDWEKDFARDMAKPESWVRYGAVTRLDPNVEKARGALLSILEKHHWFLRAGAIQTLRGANGEALEDLRKELKKHSSPMVREGIALAFGGMNDPGRAADLVEALADKDERVRRGAAIGLGHLPSKEAVAGLLGAWEKEKQSDVIVFLRESLEKISGKFFGRNVDDWKAWWKAVESDWQPPAKKDEGGGAKPPPGMPGGGTGAPQGEKSDDDKKAEGDGNKTKEETTVLRDVELNFKEAGKGGPVFVLPEYGYNGIYMEKHLLALDDVARLFYIDLPGTSSFKNLPIVAGGMPEYPIDKLCDAFDELRKLRKQDRIAILGHGMAGWIAMRYATKYPRNVSHLILVSTWTSGKAWGDGRNRAEVFGKQQHDIEYEHFAQSCLLENGTPRYSAAGQDDAQALDRAQWTGYFHDIRNPYAIMFWPKVDRSREMGGCIIPQFNIEKEKGNPVPTLILYGTSPRAVWTSEQDQRAITKCYPNAQVVPCPQSNRMPMVEDYDLFVKSVKGFFRKFPFSKGAKKP